MQAKKTCSDRWMFDRLTRCHWLWRQYKRAIRREEQKPWND